MAELSNPLFKGCLDRNAVGEVVGSMSTARDFASRAVLRRRGVPSRRSGTDSQTAQSYGIISSISPPLLEVRMPRSGCVSRHRSDSSASFRRSNRTPRRRREADADQRRLRQMGDARRRRAVARRKMGGVRLPPRKRNDRASLPRRRRGQRPVGALGEQRAVLGEQPLAPLHDHAGHRGWTRRSRRACRRRWWQRRRRSAGRERRGSESQQGRRRRSANGRASRRSTTCSRTR